MATLIRFFDNNLKIIEIICVYGKYVYYDFIKWIELHDIGNIYDILMTYRFHARYKYGSFMFIYNFKKNIKNIYLKNVVDVQKINHICLINAHCFMTNKTIIDTPLNHRILASYHS